MVVAAIGRLAGAAPAYFPPAITVPSIDCGDPLSIPGGIEPVLTPDQAAGYARILADAREPSLYVASPSRRGMIGTIRLAWLRSFQAPVIVRVEGMKRPAPTMVATQLAIGGGESSERVTARIRRSLTGAEADRLRREMDRAALTTRPGSDCRMGADGTRWIIEHVDAGGYRLISRWSPRPGSVRDLGAFMLSLTGWSFPRID